MIRGIVTVAVAAAVSAWPSAQDAAQVKVTVPRANVRSEANDRAPVLTQLPAGTLVPLISVLGRASAGGEAERVAATRRFSTLGIAAVCAIFLSGVLNTASTVGDFFSILDTPYGELLVAKLALFVVIVVLAAVNRVVLMPRLDWRALRRNAIAECILGLCVIAIVGQLGITEPAGHHHFHG